MTNLGITSLTLLLLVASVMSNYLTPQDKERLKQVFDPAWSLSDLQQVLYSSAGYKHLGLKVPNTQNVCNFVVGSMKESVTIESLFYASSAAKALDCPLTASAVAKQAIHDSLREGASSQELFHSILAANNLGIEVDSVKVLRLTQQALKKDDGVLSLGYVFHVGSHIKGDVSSIFERIEDAIVQSDEVDGQMLQFEGGLSITALVLNGAYKLAEASKKDIPMKPEQAVKFANYLMSRKSVQMAKGAYYLLDAINMFANNKFHIPVAITLASSVAVSKDAPNIKVQLTDLLGASLGALKLTAVSATKESDSTVIFSNQPMKQLAKEKSIYELDIMSKNPPRGFYKLLLKAEGGDARLVGHNAASLSFKVLSAVEIVNVELGTADADQSTSPSLMKVTHPKKLPSILEADQHQKLLLRFTVKDLASKKATKVHQAFVKVTHKQTNREIIFVSESDSNDVYKFDMDVSGKRKEFGSLSGTYTLTLIIGDATIVNPLEWQMADVKLSFPDTGGSQTLPEDYTYKSRPDIQHLFRSSDARPPTIVSVAFMVLCLMPLGVLLLGWSRLGVNVSNFTVSLCSVGFHLGLGAIFGLFCLFWLRLDMFTTIKYLTMIGIVTFFCGNSMLSKIAANRKESKTA